MTSPCSIIDLQLAIAGDLPPEQEQALNQHLEQCETCSTAIEQLAGGTAWCAEAAALLAGDDLDDAVPSREECSEVDFTVEHLEPSEEPNVLGRLGGYDVLQVIGHGGMSVVLKAHDRELNRYVAIKVLAPHLAQSSLAKKRFIREAQAAAAVVHPHVIAIHQVQPNGRLPFLVMPLVAGESLAQRLAAQGRLELKETLRIGMQAAAGLSAAHEQGLVHRDVKPANILLEKGVERAVLTDFGLARAADDVSMTRWGMIAGTPQYMSPEQARGEPLDGRSDLFSLGCVLYEMATGVSPFRADSTLATLRRLIDDPPPALASLNPELPPWFVAIVNRLLEKDPARRFSSAKEVSELLEGCLAHLQQPTNVPLPASVSGTLRVPPPNGTRSVPDTNDVGTRRRKPFTKGTLAMLTLIGISLFAAGVVATNPPDIAGQWSGENWGQVTLTQTALGEYSGTYTDTVVKDKGLGKIDLKWSRIERQFNGTWREGEFDRFGEIVVHREDDSIRGAFTTDAKSKVNPATPHLATLLWTSRGQAAKGSESKAADFIPAAERLVDLLDQGEFDKAVAYFDATMKKAEPPAELKKLWQQLAEVGGKFAGRGQPRTGSLFGYDIVYVPGNWEHNKLDFKVVFDKDGKIGGLWMVAPGTGASADETGGSQTLPSAVPKAIEWLLSQQGNIGKSAESAAPAKLVPIKKFTTADKPLSGSLAVHDGAWSATVKAPETLHLFEVADPGAEDCKLFYRAKLRTQDFQGQVYLEMWCRLPGKGEFFSRGLENALTGTSGWISCETPFILKAGQRPDLIRLNVVAQGTGTVSVKDVELLRTAPECMITLVKAAGDKVTIDGKAPAKTRIAFHAGDNRGNGWSCGFPQAGHFTAKLDLVGGKLQCRVGLDDGTPMLTLHGVDRIGSAVLSEGQLSFHAETPTIASDGASTATFGQWTAKSGEKVDINVTLLPPETAKTPEKEPESRDIPSIVEKAVKVISTCAEGDPRVGMSLATLKGLDQTKVVTELAKLLDSKTDTMRRAAVYILWKGEFQLIEPAVDGLLKLCDHEEDLTRGMAALALGANHVAKSLTALEKMTTDDKSGYARRCAAYALGLLGDPAAIGVLEKALKDPESLVRANAKTALEMLQRNKTKVRTAELGFDPIVTLGNLLGFDPLPELIKQEIARQLHDAGADYDDLQVSVAELRDSATPFAVKYKGLRHFKYTFGGKPDPHWPDRADGQFIVEYIGGGQWQGKLGDTQFTAKIGHTDNIDLPFVDDPAILGQWKALDFVAKPAEFDPANPSWKGEHFFQGLTFLPGGKTPLSWFTWTKGVVIHHGDQTAEHYEIREIKGRKYLFMEWKNGDVMFRGQKPRYCVMAKTDSDAATPSKKKISTDRIIVEDLALQMIVAIRERDDKKLRTFASDRIKAWPDALPVFAVELRERYRQNTGNERFDLRASEALVDGDLAAVRCTGPKELEGKCLVLFFIKSGGHWLNYSLRAAMENVPLTDHLAYLKMQIEKEQNKPPSK